MYMTLKKMVMESKFNGILRTVVTQTFVLNPTHLSTKNSKCIIYTTCYGAKTSLLRPTVSKLEGPFYSTSSKIKKSLNPKSELARLFEIAKPELVNISGAIALLVVSSSITLAVPFCMGKIIDLVQSIANDAMPQSEMQPVVTGLCALFVLGAVANAGRIYLLQTSGQRITKTLRERVFESIMAQDMQFFDQSATGELINRLASDVEIVSGAVTQNLSDGLRSLAQISAGIGMMYFMSPDLANVILMVLPPVAIGAVVYGRFIRQITKDTQTSLARSTQMADERISNIRTVRSFGKESFECKMYSRKVNDVLQFALKEAKAKAVFFGMTGLAGNLIMVLVLYNGGVMMHSGQITVGDLSAFLLYSGYVAISIGGMSNFFTAINKSLGASSRLWELTDSVPVIPLQAGVFPDNTLLKEDIDFKNLCFAYPTRKQHKVFSDVNISFKSGKVTAIVGPSGCGKSTVGVLLLRFYDPDTGEIAIGGQNIKGISPAWIRNNVGIVSQNPILFSGTVGDNITYGSLSHNQATMQQLEEVSIQANAYKFISCLQDGFNTLVGERGITLSGGQQQRIAIARALLKDPKILLLDEATSALDAESEDLVRDALEKAAIGRTTIIIAHRLSTVRRADKIIVFDENGSVSENGSYNELMNHEHGVFKRMVEKQKILFS
uniref:ATP-binding cassette sub-family B member 9-like n=1 Tax=Phallusia mammillata TaxID=59560 RepID=A0A6F9D5A2_9ASCI|nr:ATP-binding cassette sub-family B member 9-like [Phallusia mammillata]